MTTYIVRGWKTPIYYASVEVEADTPDEALTKARDELDNDAPYEDASGDYGPLLEMEACDADNDAFGARWFDPDERVRMASADLLATLKAVLPYAESHAEDWADGCRDGTYEDHDGLEACQNAIERANAMLAKLEG